MVVCRSWCKKGKPEEKTLDLRFLLGDCSILSQVVERLATATLYSLAFLLPSLKQKLKDPRSLFSISNPSMKEDPKQSKYKATQMLSQGNFQRELENALKSLSLF